ncbi:hypothetical protein HDU90_004047 [Geranomyces variabilis]|nr:hypothetical protein HDU90_004047 [Geranomyces variabilis]
MPGCTLTGGAVIFGVQKYIRKRLADGTSNPVKFCRHFKMATEKEGRTIFLDTFAKDTEWLEFWDEIEKRRKMRTAVRRLQAAHSETLIIKEEKALQTELYNLSPAVPSSGYECDHADASSP